MQWPCPAGQGYRIWCFFLSSFPRKRESMAAATRWRDGFPLSRLCENSEPTACIGRILPKSGDLDSEDSRRPAPRFECSKRRADPGVFTQPGKRESMAAANAGGGMD